MTCTELDERLDDWLDGALPPSEAREVEAHLAGCQGCREGSRRLRELLAHAAALPRSVAPPRDLWPGIEGRIARPSAWSWLFAWGNPVLVAAAATVVIGLVAVLWVHQTPGTVQTVEIPATSPAAVERVAASAGPAPSDPVLAQAEREYEAAASALLRALQQRKDVLPAETLARVQENMQVIDEALAEVRSALAKDPHNPELNQMLVATHRRKVDVLQRVVRLSTAL